MQNVDVFPSAGPKTAAPRPPNHSSVPSLLASLQNEYDSVMFEMFELKKAYDHVRQELAHALYANDAANRVVARLMWERDEARSALANIKGTLGTGTGSASAQAAGTAEDADMADGAGNGSVTGLSDSVTAKFDATHQKLSSQRMARRKRKAAISGYAIAGDIKAFGQASVLSSMHSTKPPGVSALDISLDGKYLLTGGNDKQVQILDQTTEKTVATLKGHSKKITRVAFAYGTPFDDDDIFGPSLAQSKAGAPKWAISASEDNTVRVWALQGDAAKVTYALAHTITGYSAPVTGLSVHPCGDVVASASKDGTWALHDLTTGARLLHVEAPVDESAEEAEGGYAYASFAFHPDGLLAASGTENGVVRIWDLKTATKVSTFPLASGSSASLLSFSENGFNLAAASAGSKAVTIFDLRKQAVSGSIALNEDESDFVRAIAFDPSAAFLAVAGSDVRVYANKTWELLVKLEDNAAEVSDVAWDRTDGAVITAGLDRTVRRFAVVAAE